MKTATELYDEVYSLVPGPYAYDRGLGFFNDCLKMVSDRFYLPALEADDTVDTTVDQDYSSLPDDFHKGLYFCYSNDNEVEVKIFNSYGSLRTYYISDLDSAGNVMGVAIKGSNIHYQYIPAAAEELQLYYYKSITLLVDTDDEPSELPQNIAEPLLINFGAREFYARLEKDDPKKPQTLYYNSLFQGDWASLAKLVPSTLKIHTPHRRTNRI